MVKPEEHAVMKEYELSQLCTKLVVGFVGTCEEFYTNGSSGVMMIRTGDIKGSYIDYSNVKYIDESFHTKNVKSQLKCGDILIARHGSSGHGVIFDSNKPANALNIVILRTDEKLLLSRYLVQLLDSPSIQKQVAEASAGSTQNVINTSQIAKLLISIPELSEQKEVGNVCEAVDSLIETLERQISKKKAIKQGAMQELLTGKKRLPGFSGEWTMHQLSDLGMFLKGSGISRAESNTGRIPAVRYGELYTTHQNYVTHFVSHISKEVATKAKQVYKGDILFAASGETKEEIGKCAAIIDDQTVYAGGDILILRPHEPHNPVFMGTLLNTAEVCRQRAEKGQGDAVVHIHADSLGSINIKIPEIKEQDAIAEILLGMDKEIEMLEKKLEKYRQLKQGMMQQLLTGKIRLK